LEKIHFQIIAKRSTYDEPIGGDGALLNRHTASISNNNTITMLRTPLGSIRSSLNTGMEPKATRAILNL
jgi:hypothetical protein